MLRFPNDVATGWRRSAERVIVLALPVFIALDFWNTEGYLLGAPPHSAIIAFTNSLNFAGLIGAALTFIATYVAAKDADRARIRWVMLGIVVGYGGQSMTSIIVVAIAVAYAVIRHRVFDVRFFIGRAVVYAVLTGIVVSLLSLVPRGRKAARGHGTRRDRRNGARRSRGARAQWRS